jgi:hypothetical protein
MFEARGWLRGGRVVSVATQVLGVGEGFMGDIARLTLTLEGASDEVPRSLIAKLPTTNPANRALGNLAGVYEREIHFYQDLSAEVGTRTPEHYYSEMDPTPGSQHAEAIARFIDRLPRLLIRFMMWFGRLLGRLNRNRYVLMIEDLSSVRVGNQVEGCSLADAKIALRAAAQMHARFWNSPRLAELPWVMPVDVSPRLFQLLFDDCREAFLNRYGPRLTARTREQLDWLAVHAVEMIGELAGPTRTLIHGDFRLDNMFFDDAAGEIVLFDWQSSLSGSGAFDVAYFLSASLRADASAEDETKLLREYHAELLRLGVADYPYEMFECEYKLGMLLVLHRLVASVSDLIDFGEERGLALMDTWIEGLVRRVEHIDTTSLLQAAAAQASESAKSPAPASS